MCDAFAGDIVTVPTVPVVLIVLTAINFPGYPQVAYRDVRHADVIKHDSAHGGLHNISASSDSSKSQIQSSIVDTIRRSSLSQVRLRGQMLSQIGRTGVRPKLRAENSAHLHLSVPVSVTCLR